MKAAWYEQQGPACEVLHFGELPTPQAGAGQLRVRLQASGVNPSDCNRRSGAGYSMEFPLIVPNSDGSGVVDQVGEGADPSWMGRRVWLMNGQRGRPFGTAAQWIALDQDLVAPLPSGLSPAEGACLGIPAMTACHCVLGDGSVEGKTVLVQGGAGTVGRFAVQIAHAAGARVLATVRGPAQREHVAEAAPDVHIVDRVSGDVPAQIAELTAGQGVDRIVEVDFGGNLQLDLAVLRQSGVVVAYASRGDPQPAFPFYSFMRKGATLRTVMASAMPAAARNEARRWLSAWLEGGQARIAIARTFSLDEIVAAHEAVETSPRLGTVVVTCT